MKRIRSIYKHISTCDIYAIETLWDGTLIGSFGPIYKENHLAPDSYTYNNKINDWIRENNDKLILFEENDYKRSAR